MTGEQRSHSHSIVAAVDTGGTFTDLVAHTVVGTIRLKVPSTPNDPGRAVLDALKALRERLPRGAGEVVEVQHGTTVATNALLERRGARTVLIATVGFEDLLRLRRQNRPDLYALHPVVPAPLVPPERCLGVRERLGPNGETWEELEPLAPWIARHHRLLSEADSVAICLLHAWRDGRHEATIAEALGVAFPSLSITCSHELAPVFREFERCSTTVVNAYLAPVMAAYLGRLRDAVMPARLSVESSAGGLLTADEAARSPAHTALSGPAGGVQGAWAVGQRAGRDRLLTLDMGGTSTDVSLLLGALRADDEGAVADQPICLPLLPIETVGAGGGSVAWVDAGGALRVGPHSAGARPGPACYGHAGADAQATVTDAHVVLGRLPSLLGGELPLDVAAATRAISRLAQQLDASVPDTAAAIIAIAAASMARACKRVSTDRGVDPRTLTLVAFGGAGGLHACELADELGCRDVLFPADPGVLSAEGIASAAPVASTTVTLMWPQRDWSAKDRLGRQGAVGARPLTDTPHALGASVSRLDVALTEVCAAARASLRRTWGSEVARTAAVTVQADTRYEGQSWTLAIDPECGEAAATRATPSPDVHDRLARRFVAAHLARYGFCVDRPLELVALRAEARAPAPSHSSATSGAGGERDIPSPQRGPHALSTWSATLWLPTGWQATRLPSGDWRCTRLDAATTSKPQGPATLALEVHRQRMAAIAEQMGVALRSAALSANIKERRDYSCAIFDGAGQLLVHAAHIPVHLGSTPASVAAAIAACEMAPGDTIMLNDPFSGGTHLPDVTVVSPVFLGQERTPRWYVANRAHHADVGGITPGSMPAPRGASGEPRHLTIADEGFCTGPVHLNDALRQAFAQASRTPQERLGDLRAQEAANLVGIRLLQQLAETHGHPRQLDEALLAYAEERMRAVLAGLPDGTWHFTDALDDDGVTDRPVPIPVTLTIAGDAVTVDLSAAPDASPGPLNAVRAIAVSAAFYAFRALAGATGVGSTGGPSSALPANAGMMRPITVVTRPGSIVDARAPSAVSSGNVETSQRLVDAIFGALAQAAPDAVPAASCGSMSNLLFGGRAADGRPFVHYETLAGGAGGGPLGPGADAIQCHMTNTHNTPVEALEHAFPVRVESYAVRSHDATALDSRVHRGGAGIIRSLCFLAPTQVTVVSERRRLAPWGLGGAPAGERGQNWLRRRGEAPTLMPAKASVQLQAGDIVEIHTPSGGSWRPRSEGLFADEAADLCE